MKLNLKKLAKLVIVVLLGFNSGYCQVPFEVIEEPLPYSKNANSFTINIIGYNEDFVMTEWQKYISEYSGTTYITSINKGVIDMESENVIFPLLNNKKVTIHTRFSPNSSLTGVLLSVWIENEDGTFFSSKTNKEEAKQIKDWLFEFQKKIKLRSKRIRHHYDTDKN